jgi:hypothetical protein
VGQFSASANNQFPASTWYHLRTSNVIELIFAPIRHRTDATKRLPTGGFATAVGLALIGKLPRKWRRLQGYRDIYKIAPARRPSPSVAHALNRTQCLTTDDILLDSPTTRGRPDFRGRRLKK